MNFEREEDKRAYRAFSWLINEHRRDFALVAFADLRENFKKLGYGGAELTLDISVHVPICADCWQTLPWYTGRDSAQPDISSDTWKTDLAEWVDDDDLKALLTELEAEDIDELRAPLCHECGRTLAYWADYHAVEIYVDTVSFEEFFPLGESDGTKVSKRLRHRILEAYGKRCFECDEELTTNSVTIDHIVARSRGGTSRDLNLQPMCKSCNEKKSNIPETMVSVVLDFPLRPVPSDAYEGVVW